MAYVADLHIHSRFANACSGQLNIPNLAKWAGYKGIDLVGTGDALHPIWFKELQKDLKDIGGGIFQHGQTKFILTAEVACIYKDNFGTKRIHILIFFPSFEAVAKLSEKLIKMGMNLAADGRPILGISAKKLAEVVFSVEPEALIIPAHIWTPWFSLYGSNSGYDHFEDCFGEFSDSIYGIETGLSSEPAMNWRVKDLDKKSILSFSDLHSLPRMGREVTLIGGSCTFAGLSNALQNQNIVGTIEFFPEEGKYHYSGHRNCNIVYDTKELKLKGKICPVCNRPLTVGVLQRIEDLAGRSEEELKMKNEGGIFKSELFPEKPGFRMLVQLEEILAESMKLSVAAQKVKDEYLRLVTSLDSELKILTKTSLDLISMTAGERVAEGVKKVREGKIHIEPGFDNTYGLVKIWTEEEEKEWETKGQTGLF